MARRIPNYGSLEVNIRRALNALQKQIDSLSGGDVEAKVNRSGDTMTGALTLDTVAGSANQALILPEGYSVYTDNAGPGTDNSRVWIDGPDEGAAYIGPRTGANLLNLIQLRADTVDCDGTALVVNNRNVVGQGSNSNGEWVRFYDGTQICWRHHSVTDQAISSAYGSLYLGSRAYTFPVAFSGTPAVSVGQCHWGTAAPWGTAISVTTSGFTARFFDVNSRATGTTMVISWQAVGRWA